METVLIEAVKKQIDELMENVRDSLKGRWDFYRHAAYLKKRGWTEDQYQHFEDPDVFRRADAVKDYYHGYEHLYVWENTRGNPWERYNDWSECYNEMINWCKSNCRGKWRQDILRVTRKRMWHNQSDNTVRYTDDGEWIMNELGGGDCLFFAFKDSRDCTMFLLRWS